MLVDKYRPQRLSEMAGLDTIKTAVDKFIESKDGIPHMLFVGKQGTGKTTLAHVIANEIFGDKKPQCFFEFNASDDRGIDTVRNAVTSLAKAGTQFHPYKIILMDEADAITPDAQTCFRRVIEMYQKTTRFIFTCNYPYKLILPLRSRFMTFEFPSADVKTIANYLKKIAKKEGLEHDDKTLIEFAKKCNGDIRQALTLLERGEADTSGDIWDSMTLAKLKGIPENERVEMAFKDDADKIMANIWEMIKKEKAWKYLPLIIDQQSKMSYAPIKDMYIADLLKKIGE